ncbi:siderophore-interacting protein [Pseudoduganella namucuonensis]|uniref:NADPH-dependent ferric siderophore reductase, contains FAD-binding and SIP domains n=1 Tax=Pseudoduganella namucuonensis TaxID=1035707 RepID=A0A1I7L6T3_9BURK|nr:siderophore-interacting protein [Pseudoduganella namucuonensis]SFV05492.1 NADPH-dependent ferric siderophore reductase, contains FAD-binding and SIP domains [Pseudoduganella namucuonensis]
MDSYQPEASRGRRVQRLSLVPKMRAVTVLDVASISPNFVRVRFGGAELAEFTSPGFDDHVKFIFGGEERIARNYTPRAYDNAARTVDIEFALHGAGAASDWAAQAAPGQEAIIAGPRGAFVVPVDYDWHLLVGDETALPAIARRLEELPAGARAFVVVQLGDDADRRALSGAADADVRWLAAGQDLNAAVRALELPAGEGYAWCAGEAAAMAALRKLLIEDKGLDKERIRAAAYWKRGEQAHHERLVE